MSNVNENEANVTVVETNASPANTEPADIGTEAKLPEQNASASPAKTEPVLSASERMSKGAALSALQSAMYRKDVLTGTVVSALVKEGIVFAGVIMDLYPDAAIYIPFSEFYREMALRAAPELRFLGTDKSPEEIARNRQTGILRHAVGAVIPFIITNMAMEQREDGGYDSVIIASRRAALDVIEKRNFTPNADGKRRINEGDQITGRIVSVGRYGMRVNFGGVDTEVRLAQATNRFVSNLSDVFATGQYVDAVIRNIKEDENHKISLVVDCRTAERLQNAHKANLAPPGSVVMGTITSSSADRSNPGQSILHAYIDTLGLPCTIRRLASATLGRDVRTGDRAVIVITGSTQDGYLRGEVKRFLPGSSQVNFR